VETRFGGRKWRCTNCQAAITIPERSDEAIEPVPEGQARPRLGDAAGDFGRPGGERRRRPVSPEEGWTEDERQAVHDWPHWAVTRVGVRTLSTGVSIFLVAWLFLIAAKYIAEANARRDAFGGGMGVGGQRDLIGILAGAVTVFIVAIPVCVTLYINGQVICCQVPRSLAAKGLAIGSLVCSVVALVAALIGFLIMVTSGPGFARPAGGVPAFTRVIIFYWLVIGFASLGQFLYLFFLAAVARHYHRVGLTINAMVLALGELLFLVFYIAIHFVKGQQTIGLLEGNVRQTVSVGRAVEIAFFVGSSALLVWLVITASLVGSAIRKPRVLRAREDY
jgi:hypothetical protein